MELTIGALIIGSLYWDENPSRRRWREARLKTTEEFRVKAPIRYGRQSQSRGNTYTMVFSQLCLRGDNLGQAIVIKCKRNISAGKDLINEAVQLWAAERCKPYSNGRLSASWGCVALLTNPYRNIPENVVNVLTERVHREDIYGKLKNAAVESPIVNVTGLLQIPWPQIVNGGGPVPLDMLLATATQPSLEGPSHEYPSAEKIAKAWKQAPQYEEYFWRNRENGIYTFQDESIKECLKH